MFVYLPPVLGARRSGLKIPVYSVNPFLLKGCRRLSASGIFFGRASELGGNGVSVGVFTDDSGGGGGVVVVVDRGDTSGATGGGGR